MPVNALSENIAFLARCGKALEDPTVNDPVSRVRPGRQGTTDHSLSLREEQRIAEAFALLLATTMNNRTIGAVAIEEKVSGDGLIVRTAVNSGSQEPRIHTFRRLINAAKFSLKPGKEIALDAALKTLRS